MKLYFAPRTRAVRARWLLEELEIPYEGVRLDLSKRENESPEYLTVSPLGELPALVDGDVTLLEPIAIALHLADRFPEKELAPPPGSPARAAYYQWLVFAESTLAPAVMTFYERAQAPATPDDGQARVRLDARLDVLDAAVATRDFLVGERFTAADLAVASILHLANHLKLLEARPRLVAYVYLHCTRPASRRAVVF